METLAEAPLGNSNGTGSMLDGTGSTSYACLACTSNSSMPANMPAAAMRDSSSSCYVMDMDAALLSSYADTAWQPGQPSSSLAAG
jgi:hypothetical protein